jgi:hypothetical protein
MVIDFLLILQRIHGCKKRVRRKLSYGEKIIYGDPEENSSHNFRRWIKGNDPDCITIGPAA